MPSTMMKGMTGTRIMQKKIILRMPVYWSFSGKATLNRSFARLDRLQALFC
jgi:hypothetical protein